MLEGIGGWLDRWKASGWLDAFLKHGGRDCCAVMLAVSACS